MSYIAPTIAGAMLAVAAFLSFYFNPVITNPVMLLLTVGAILISLPAIKRFQLNKDGFLIEVAEREQIKRYSQVPEQPKLQTHNKQNILLESSTRIEMSFVRWLGDWRSGLAIPFLYGAISGTLSAASATTFFSIFGFPALSHGYYTYQYSGCQHRYCQRFFIPLR
jgi:hypothetical protein